MSISMQALKVLRAADWDVANVTDPMEALAAIEAMWMRGLWTYTETEAAVVRFLDQWSDPELRELAVAILD